MKKGTPE